MQILTECNLAQLVVELLNGKVVVFPTETSYGIGCDATNQEAVNRIYDIKGRKNDKPLLVVVPDVKMAKQYLEWNEMLEKIANNYWPGAVTVVGKCKGGLAQGVVSKEGTVAVRVTANDLLQSITEKLGKPLVATSANLSDTGDVYDSSAIIGQYQDRAEQPDIILNHGTIPPRKPSTLVSVVGDTPVILRQGEVLVEL